MSLILCSSCCVWNQSNPTTTANKMFLMNRNLDRKTSRDCLKFLRVSVRSWSKKVVGHFSKLSGDDEVLTFRVLSCFLL